MGSGAGVFTQTASCPDGKVTLGGGFTYDPSSSLAVSASYPVADGSGWRVEVKRSNNAATVFTVWAVCVVAAA